MVEIKLSSSLSASFIKERDSSDNASSNARRVAATCHTHNAIVSSSSTYFHQTPIFLEEYRNCIWKRDGIVCIVIKMKEAFSLLRT